MTNYYYTHTDFFNYLSHNVKNSKSLKKNQKNINQYFFKMLNELKEITNNNLIIPTYNYDFGKKEFLIYTKIKVMQVLFQNFLEKNLLKIGPKFHFFHLVQQSECPTTPSKTKL